MRNVRVLPNRAEQHVQRHRHVDSSSSSFKFSPDMRDKKVEMSNTGRSGDASAQQRHHELPDTRHLSPVTVHCQSTLDLDHTARAAAAVRASLTTALRLLHSPRNALLYGPFLSVLREPARRHSQMLTVNHPCSSALRSCRIPCTRARSC